MKLIGGYMTNEEQIIIDDIDVSGCLFYQSNFEEDYDVRIKHFCSNWHNSCESSNNSNCYFKQLARKTQECEKLKEKLRDIELKNTTLQNRYQQLNGSITECDRYRKALEEIETEATSLKHFNFGYDELGVGDEVIEYANIILDIINKAKGEV